MWDQCQGEVLSLGQAAAALGQVSLLCEGIAFLQLFVRPKAIGAGMGRSDWALQSWARQHQDFEGDITNLFNLEQHGHSERHKVINYFPCTPELSLMAAFNHPQLFFTALDVLSFN